MPKKNLTNDRLRKIIKQLSKRVKGVTISDAIDKTWFDGPEPGRSRFTLMFRDMVALGELEYLQAFDDEQKGDRVYVSPDHRFVKGKRALGRGFIAKGEYWVRIFDAAIRCMSSTRVKLTIKQLVSRTRQSIKTISPVIDYMVEHQWAVKCVSNELEYYVFGAEYYKHQRRDLYKKTKADEKTIWTNILLGSDDKSGFGSAKKDPAPSLQIPVETWTAGPIPPIEVTFRVDEDPIPAPTTGIGIHKTKRAWDRSESIAKVLDMVGVDKFTIFHHFYAKIKAARMFQSLLRKDRAAILWLKSEIKAKLLADELRTEQIARFKDKKMRTRIEEDLKEKSKPSEVDTYSAIRGSKQRCKERFGHLKEAAKKKVVPPVVHKAPSQPKEEPKESPKEAPKCDSPDALGKFGDALKQLGIGLLQVGNALSQLDRLKQEASQ